MNKDRYEEIVREYIDNHEILTCQDLLKFCYQGCYGPNHLLTERESAHKYFMEEYQSVVPAEGDMIERISENYVRINLTAYKYQDLPAEWLFAMFCESMAEKESQEEIVAYFEVVQMVLTESGKEDLAKEWEVCTHRYLENGQETVHHSEEYRHTEKPHYRIILSKYEKILPILQLMAQKQKQAKKALTFKYCEDYTGELVAMPVESKQNEILVLAIEGRAASGKSTLAMELSKVTKYPIIKMDHFFLPKSLQKPKRLKESGGNIHYERFIEEVLVNLKEDQPFSYTIYDCQVGGPNGMEAVPVMPWRIVEGVYSQHPKFGDYADVKVFVDVSPEEQMRRIRIRNGVQMARKFREEWIPMEEVYFHVNRHEKNADYVCDTTK